MLQQRSSGGQLGYLHVQRSSLRGDQLRLRQQRAMSGRHLRLRRCLLLSQLLWLLQRGLDGPRKRLLGSIRGILIYDHDWG